MNLGGPFHLAKFGIPALIRAGGGSIILTASELGIVGASKTVAYCAAKGGVINMTRAMAIDCAPHEIRVNCLAPGPVDTPMLTSWYEASGDPEAFRAAQEEPVLLKRAGRPEEIAEHPRHRGRVRDGGRRSRVPRPTPRSRRPWTAQASTRRRTSTSANRSSRSRTEATPSR